MMMTTTTTTMTRKVRAGLRVEKGGKHFIQFSIALSVNRGHDCSGISVENPDSRRSVPGGDMVRDLLRRAAQ